MKAALFATALLVGVTIAAGTGRAADPQDELFDLATIEADHDLCGFSLSDEQKDIIAQRREALVTQGDVTAEDVAAIQDQVAASAQRQKVEGLCRPDGAEARLYKRRLTGLGLL